MWVCFYARKRIIMRTFMNIKLNVGFHHQRKTLKLDGSGGGRCPNQNRSKSLTWGWVGLIESHVNAPGNEFSLKTLFPVSRFHFRYKFDAEKGWRRCCQWRGGGKQTVPRCFGKEPTFTLQLLYRAVQIRDDYNRIRLYAWIGNSVQR